MVDDGKGGNDDMMLFCVLVLENICNWIVGKGNMPLHDFSHHFCHGVDCTYCRNYESTHLRPKTLRYDIPIFCTNIPGRPRRN